MAVVFAVNGERFELRDGDDPGATLLDFLRSRTRFTGPKLGCGEGTPPNPSPPLRFFLPARG
jgi:abscisic-aldehyde oxidase